MKTLTLTRFINNSYITLGSMVSDGFACYTIERPWADNKPFFSCIPEGEYIIQRDFTGRYRYYRVLDVPDRKDIEFHPGNYAENFAGCIGPGESYNPTGVYDSKSAMDRFMVFMDDDEQAKLIIKRI